MMPNVRGVVARPRSPRESLELSLPVVHDCVRARARVSLRVPARRLSLQHLDQHGMLPDIGEIPEMPVSHDPGSSWLSNSTAVAKEHPCLNVYILLITGNAWIGDLHLPDLNATSWLTHWCRWS